MPFCVHCRREAQHSSVRCPHARQDERETQHVAPRGAQREHRRVSGWRPRSEENRALIADAKTHLNDALVDVFQALEHGFRKARVEMADHPIEAYLSLRQTRRRASSVTSTSLTPEQRENLVTFLDRVDLAIRRAEDGDPDIADVFAPWVNAATRRHERDLAVATARDRLDAHRAKNGLPYEAAPATEEGANLSVENTQRRLDQMEAAQPPDPSLKDLQFASSHGGRVVLVSATAAAAAASASAFYFLMQEIAEAFVALCLVLGVAWLAVSLRAQSAQERLELATYHRRVWEHRNKALVDEIAIFKGLASACWARDAENDEHGRRIAIWEETHPDLRHLVREAAIVGLDDDGRE